jgi:hypothetical protein
MDKKGKVIIVTLIAIGLGAALALGTNLLPKRGEPERGKGGDEEALKSSVERYGRSGWIGSLDGLLGRFSPELDARRLRGPTAGNACALEKDLLQVYASDASCLLGIRPQLPDCDDDYESLSMQLLAKSTATRNTPVRINVNPGLTHTQPHDRLRPHLAGVRPQDVLVKYQPVDEPAALVRQQEDKFRLIVLDQGGTLTVECRSCSKSRPLRLILSTRESCRG